jgi:hypothetical protein
LVCGGLPAAGFGILFNVGFPALPWSAPPGKDPVEINAAIREVVELTSGEAVKNGVCVRTDLAEDLPLIQGDRVQLNSQRLWNEESTRIQRNLHV